MLKNLIIYRIAPLFVPALADIEAALAKAPFMECGATQEKSLGWVPPRGDAHGPLAESVGGQWILRFMVETKVLPYFDFAHMTRLAVGKDWRQASPEQKAALTQEFKTLLVRTYSNALTQYRNQQKIGRAHV